MPFVGFSGPVLQFL